MDKTRCILQRTRRGFIIRSFDFTQSIFIPFEGEGSLTRAMMYAKAHNLDLIQAPDRSPATVRLWDEGGRTL